MTQQHNAQPASVSSAYAHYYYTRNGLGKIVTEEKRGAAFDAYTCGGTYTGGLVAAYEYSPRGELIEAQTRYLAPSQYGAAPAGDMLAGRSWEYEFDDTGNLLRKSLIDDTWYCVSDFGADNSIQTRTTTAGALVDGAAAAGARVYVGGAKQSPAASQTSLTRNGLGTYFYMVVPYATGSAGVYDDGIFTVAEKSGQVAFAQRDAYVPNSLLKKSRHAPQQALCAFQQGGITDGWVHDPARDANAAGGAKRCCPAVWAATVRAGAFFSRLLVSFETLATLTRILHSRANRS